jgi:GTPase SAR1 family protein
VTATPDDGQRLIEAVGELRDAVAETSLPLTVRGREDAEVARRDLLRQLDDYVLPRLRSIDAPLLAVVGGSTGAGKSTLVNSLVGAQVSRSGVIRPTTTRPVLVHHPDDAHWFADTRILPSLARVSGSETDEAQPGPVRLARSTALPPGMALLDAPDIDSVVEANRDLAGQLLSAADLWLFVTTAARYADAVPWDLLRTAAERGTAVAIILDRVPADAVDEIRPHLVSMLREQGLSTAPVFSVPESTLTPEGFLPPEAMARLKGWLDALASDARARSIVVSQTLRGAISSLEGRTTQLARAAHQQQDARATLLAAVDDEFARALGEVKDGMTDGTLLRGEVLARWQEFVGTGEFFRQVESTIGKWRDRVVAALKGAPAPAATLGEALQTGVAALVTSHGESAVAESARDLRRLDGGEAILAAEPALASTSPDFRSRVDRMVREWQGEIFDMVRSEGGNRRTNARVAAYGVNGIGLFLMLVTFASTGGLTGAEVGIAGGTSVLAQRVLEAVFGDQAVREMAARARRLLLDRVDGLYAAERARFVAAIDAAGDADGQAQRLDDAARALTEAIR